MLKEKIQILKGKSFPILDFFLQLQRKKTKSKAKLCLSHLDFKNLMVERKKQEKRRKLGGMKNNGAVASLAECSWCAGSPGFDSKPKPLTKPGTVVHPQMPALGRHMQYSEGLGHLELASSKPAWVT